MFDAEQAALAAKAAAKRQAELDKLSRRVMRDHERKQKQPDQVALCGINFYTRSPRDRARGTSWTLCASCGKPLRYFDTYEQAQAANGECRRR
jgi:hypothetical protein